MIYPILKQLLSVTVRGFFKNYKVKHLEYVPSEAPLLIVANHPGTFMDPIVIASNLPREVSFISKAEVFKGALAKWLLPKFNMIPVYRKQDDPSLMGKNQDTFVKVYELLESKGAILIFPEGVSLNERRLKEIKTGTARMAFGAEARNEFKLGVKILPIGLTYSDQHQFQSDLLIKIGAPINVADFKSQYDQDNFNAVNLLTEEIRIRLESLVVDIQDNEVDTFVKRVETVYKSKMLYEMGFSSKMPDQDFIVTQMINKRIHYFLENNPERVYATKKKIDDYHSILNRLHLEDNIVSGKAKRLPIALRFLLITLYFIIGAPLFVFGAINNFIPYKLPYQIAKRSKDLQFLGAIMMVSGTFIFLIFYATQIGLIHHFFDNRWITFSYALLLPFSGLFAYRYWKRLVNTRKQWFFFSLFLQKSTLAAELIQRRKEIIDDLEQGRKDYDAIFNL